MAKINGINEKGGVRPITSDIRLSDYCGVGIEHRYPSIMFQASVIGYIWYISCGESYHSGTLTELIYVDVSVLGLLVIREALVLQVEEI